MRSTFVNTIYQAAGKDGRIICILGDIGAFLFRHYRKDYPDQLLNLGIAEANMVGVASGLALSGKIPFVYTIAPFASMRCFEQIKVDVCYQNTNVKIVGVGAGISYGSLGSTHHAITDIALMRSLPNMTVLSPSCPLEVEEAVAAAIEHVGPVYIRLGLSGDYTPKSLPDKFSIGKARLLRQGSSASIIATGSMVGIALQAAEMLSPSGVDCRVIGMHTIKPFDAEVVAQTARETKVLVTLEEHTINGGLGSAVAEVLAEQGLTSVAFKRLGLADVFCKQYGKFDYLLAQHGLSPNQVAQTVRSLYDSMTNSNSSPPLHSQSAQAIVDRDLRDVVERVGDKFKQLSGKTVLVTGPNGLLGSYLMDTVVHLNRTYLESPCKAIGLYRSPIKEGDRAYHLQGDPNVELIQHDVVRARAFDEPIDYIIHAAGRSAPAIFQANPLGTVDVNVKGIRWLLELALERKSKSVLFLSSGEIYGRPSPDNIPTPETYNGNVSPLAPRACYTESKRLAETLCSIYHKEYGVPVKIVRPFLVYGAGLPLDDRRVMADFMRNALDGRVIEMLSEGLDTRSYCYISDATVAFWEVLLSDCEGEVFNVASDKEEISIRRLAELCHELAGIQSPPTVKKRVGDAPFLKGAPTRVLPDITKLRDTFGFEPQVNMREGLRRTINWNLALMGKKLLD